MGWRTTTTVPTSSWRATPTRRRMRATQTLVSQARSTFAFSGLFLPWVARTPLFLSHPYSSKGVELKFCKLRFEGVLRSWTLRSVAKAVDTSAGAASIRCRPGPMQLRSQRTGEPRSLRSSLPTRKNVAENNKKCLGKRPTFSQFIALLLPVDNDVGVRLRTLREGAPTAKRDANTGAFEGGIHKLL